MKLTKSFGNDESFNSSMLAIGEMMEYKSSIILRTYGGLVSLTNPHDVWTDRDGNIQLEGRKLLPGESVTLTQE